MKIYLLGRGHRLEQIRQALGMSRQDAVLLDGDAASARVAPPDREVTPRHLIMVGACDGPALRASLSDLAGQRLPARMIVFTSVRSRLLAREYPDFLFRDEGLIYKNELRELQRRAAGRQKVDTIRALARGKPFLT